MASRRCPVCGELIFLSLVEPTYQNGYDEASGAIKPALELIPKMRPSTILNKTARPKKKRKRTNLQNYRKIATAERDRAISRMFGTLGPASPVRKIDPKTGRIIAIIEIN